MQDDEALGSPLAKADRLQRRAARVGFDWPDARGPLAKVKEETAELEREARNQQTETIEAELGDLLFAVVNLARKLGIDPDHALARANDKFRRRFEALERLAQQRGLVMGRASLEQLDRLWEEGKKTVEDGRGRERAAAALVTAPACRACAGRRSPPRCGGCRRSQPPYAPRPSP